MLKHARCYEDGCQLAAAKGYRDCAQSSGVCDMARDHEGEAIIALAKHCADGAPPPGDADLSEVITLLASEVVRLSEQFGPNGDARDAERWRWFLASANLGAFTLLDRDRWNEAVDASIDISRATSRPSKESGAQ